MPTVYLIHFSTPYKHARHYLGYTSLPLEERLARHRNGTGARLLKVVQDEGIEWEVVRTWEVGTKKEARRLELRLKSWHGHGAFCPVCKAEREKEEVEHE